LNRADSSKIKGAAVKWIRTRFGEQLDYDLLAEGCDVIILGVMKHMIVPVCVLLPHQVYRNDVEKLMAKHDVDEIVIIPYRSSDVLTFTKDKLFAQTKGQ
jgi:hypothetical protein